MRLVAWLMLCVCAVAADVQSHNVTRRESGSGSGKRVVCYYTNWSVYRPGTAKFSPQNINPYLCTHLIYAFGGLTRENSLRPYDKYQDIEQGGYAKFTGLKTYNKQLKTMLAIGGWNEGSTRFSPLVADEERRGELVHNVVRFLRQNHFDGLDLDWEYPAFRDGGKPRDRANYALFVQELRAEFDRETAKTGRPRLLLTMAVPAGIEYIDKGYDIPKLNRYLDFMNILSYDYHSAFEPAVNHHSPLYPLEEDSEYNFDAQLSIDYTINHYMKLGADRDKLVLGIPTYGRSYTLFNPLATEIGAPADGPGEQGDATREKGYLAYYEICESLKSDDWKVEHPNPDAMGPYAYKGNQWVGYDDIDIVKQKSRYVSENGLGGIMFWAIDNDDFRGNCHGRPYPLIEAGKEAMLASSGTSNDVVSVVPSRGSSSKMRQKHISSSSSNVGSGSGRQGPQSEHRTHKKRPSGRRHHDKTVRSTTSSPTTSTSTTPVYNYPQNTPEPPTTPDPGSDFKCKDEGFFPHPRDCKKYFWCLDSGPSNLGIVAHQFTCPSGLFFNKGADSCDYARNVVCKKKSGDAGGSTTTKAPPITAATSRTTRISSSTASTTTTTTSTTPEPEIEEEYEDEEYEDEEEEEPAVQEDPQAIKELIILIKKLGGVEQLEKQFHLHDSDQDIKSGQVSSGFSRSLYDRVLSRSNNRGNSAFSGDDSPTTPRYTSVYRNRPVKPQNEGLEGLDEVRTLRRDKPQYVTIQRDRPSTPVPEDEEEEDEEEEEDVPITNNERDRGEDTRSQASPVEYVTIRRARPTTSVDTDSTTPRYITIQRTRKPAQEPEVDDSDRDLDVQDITTEIRPVYTSTTEKQPGARIQIVTPSRKGAIEKETSYRKGSRDEELEDATLEPELKVSEGRGEFRGKPPGTYPQYVDVTSIGRRRQSTTPEAQVDSTTPIPPPEDPIPYVEVNSITRSRNTDLNSDTTGSASSSTSPQPLLIETQPQYVDITSLSRRRGTTTSSSDIQEEDPATTTPKTSNKNYPKYKSRLHSTVLTYSDAPTPAPETQQQKYKHINSILRRRSTTEVPINDIPLSETQPIDIDTDPNIQTIPPQITTPITLPETTPSPSVPETLPTPTTTKFTPTVTRIITSVTESGTTERQRIAVNRVPYIAIAALRGETVYPGPAIQNRYPTVPINQRILHPTTEATSPLQPESFSPVEQNTIPVTISNEHKLEKVMEVNRITLVTLKEELPLAYTRTLSGNETTERILVDGTSEKTMDKLSEVTRFKYVTFVGGSQTTSPVDDYVTDVLPEVVSTLPTPVGTPPETTDHENAIDTQNDLQSEKPHYYSSTSRFNLDPYVTDSLPVTVSLFPGVTAKQTESTVATLETSSTDITLSSVSTFSLKRQGEGRKPGVDDFKRRRTRPTFSTTSVNVDSSTPSTFSQKRRGQYKRPRPYRPTSTTVADGEADVSPSPDDSNVADESADVDRNNEPRRTFVPNSGLRKRPRPYRPTSTSTTSDDEVKIPEGNDGSDNVLVTESVSDTTVQLIPKRGNRKRGTTQKPTTETSTATSTTTTSYEEEIGELSTTVEAVKELDESFTVLSEEGDILDSPQNEKSSTQSLDISSPENMSKFVPKRGNVSTELNLKTTLSDDVEPIFVKNSTEANTLDSSQNDKSNTQGLDVSSPHNRTKFFPKRGNKIGTSSTESNLKSTFSDEVEAISIDNSTEANSLDSFQNDKSSTQGLDVSSPQNRPKFLPKRGNKIGTSSTESNLKSTSSNEVEAISIDNSTEANSLDSSQNDKSSTQGLDASIPQNRSKVLPKRGNKIGTSSTESNLNSTFLDEVEAISINNSTEANTLHSSQNDKSSTRGLDTGPQNRSKFYPRRGNRIGTGSTATSLKSTTFSDDVETSSFNNSTEANILDSSKNDKSSTQGLDTSPQNRLKLYPKRGNRIRTVSTESNLKSTSLSDDVETSSFNNSTEANKLDSSQTDQSGTQRLDTSPQNRSKLYPRRGNRVGTVSTESNLKSTSLSDDVETSSIKSYPNTTSTSPEVDSKSGVIDYNTDLNSTGTHTNKSVSDTKDAVEGKTFRPPSPSTSTDSVTPASTDNGSGQGDRVRIKKRRRRPVTRSSTQTTPTDSKGEGKASVVNNQQETQNEIDRDQTTTSPSSSYDPEQTAATSFATAALLGRDHYEVSTPGSGGEFLTTVDREGKHMVKISVLNNPNDKFVVQKGQKSKSSSDDDDDKSNARNSTAPNPSNDSTTEDNDLSTDGSAYATANIGRNSFLTLSASVKSSSEEIRNSFMTATVEFPTEGPSEGRKNSKATVKASTRQQPKDYFIASVDFTTDSGDVETLGPTRKPDASGRKKPGSDGKSRRLVRRKRPSTTTVEPQIQSEVVTTTTRSLRRPTGALYTPNRLRQRSTTTTSTTETPESSTAEPQQQRRKPGARLVRRRKYGSPANRTSDSDATATGIEPLDASSIAPSDKAGSGGLVRKYSFPRRRATTTPPPVTTTLLPITTLLPNDAPEPARGDMQLLESKEHQSTEADAEQELTTTKLPDLANAAVIAIHNLATVPPTTLPAPEIVKTTRTTPAPRRSSQSLSSTPLIPRRGSAVFVSEQPIPSPPSPRRLTGSGSLRPRPFSKTTPNPVPTTSPRAQTSRPRPPPIIDYEYYDDDDVGILDVAPVSGKVKIHSDGYIECLDRGNFPHPFSCKKFISCAKMENGELLGWEYTCPRQLSFDPIGGICNWSAGLGCKE